MLDKFEAAALEAIQKAMQAVTGSGKLETRILNAEYNMGKFAALVEILEGMNTERFVSVVDQTAADRDRVTKFIEQIYSMLAKQRFNHTGVFEYMTQSLNIFNGKYNAFHESVDTLYHWLYEYIVACLPDGKKVEY